eukprot:g67300.t1
MFTDRKICLQIKFNEMNGSQARFTPARIWDSGYLKRSKRKPLPEKTQRAGIVFCIFTGRPKTLHPPRSGVDEARARPVWWSCRVHPCILQRIKRVPLHLQYCQGALHSKLTHEHDHQQGEVQRADAARHSLISLATPDPEKRGPPRIPESLRPFSLVRWQKPSKTVRLVARVLPHLSLLNQLGQGYGSLIQ